MRCVNRSVGPGGARRFAVGASIALVAATTAAGAQTPPAPPAAAQPSAPPAARPAPPGYSPPPQGYSPAPPGYYPPPEGYYPLPPMYAMMPAAMIGPPQLDYVEGQPVRPGYRPVTEMRKGMFIGGTVTLGSLWVLSLLTGAVASAASSAARFGPLYIPVVGPFVTIGTAPSADLGTAVLVLDGPGQSAGLALAIAGAVLKDTYLLRNDLSSRVTVAPMRVGDRTMGVGLSGSL